MQGLKSLANIGSTRKVQQMLTPQEVDINADVAPMTALLEKLGSDKTVRQSIFYWVEHDTFPQTITTKSSQSTSGSFDIQAATLLIDVSETTGVSYAYACIPGTLLLVERTGEMMRVTAVTDNTTYVTLTVSRGVAGTSAAIIAASGAVEEIRIIGSAFAEGSSRPITRSIEPAIKNASPQTFRFAIGATRRDINSENYGDKEEFARLTSDAVEEIARQKESVFLLSLGGSSTDATITKGLEGYTYTGTNVRNQAGTLDEASLEVVALNVARRNSNKGSKFLYCFNGENFQSALDSFGRDYLRLVSDDTKLGLPIKAWRCGAIEFKSLIHPLLGPLAESVTASNRGGIGKAFFINLALCGQVHFKGGDMFVQRGVQDPGTDGKIDVYTEDAGFFLKSEQQHAQIYGITG